MTVSTVLSKEQLDKINGESPQNRVDLFAEQRSASMFMASGIFRIFPILIPGWNPVSYLQAVFGVNADETAGPGSGWIVVFPSYQSMAGNDTLRLFMGKSLKPGEAPDPTDKGTLIDTVVVPQDHNNEDTVGVIPRSAVQKAGIHELWFTVERSSGQGPEVSEKIVVLFKPVFPDSRDPTGNTGERVPLEAPRFPGLIDKPMLAAGPVDFVIPAWPNMFAGDKVELDINGLIVEYEITAADIGKDITIKVSSDVLKAIGPADPLLASYTITDLVLNRSLSSAVGVGVLDPDTNYLDAPSVSLADNDTVAIDALNFAPMDVDIPVRRADAVAGDQVELTMSDAASGFSKTYGPFPYKAGVVTVPVLFEDVRNLAPTTIKLAYERIRTESGSTTRTPSYPYSPRLIAAAYRAPAPTVPQARGAVLPAQLIETPVYFGPDVKGLKLGDKVTLTCLSTSAGGTTRLQTYERFVTAAMEIPNIGTVVPFAWETRHLETYPDGTVQLSCEVTGEGHFEPLKSAVLHLRIGPVNNTLGVIDVVKDTNGLLDPKDIPFGTPAICPASVHTQIGDTVHMEVWRNVNNPDEPGERVFADSLPVTAKNVGLDVEFRLSHELINGLLNNVIGVVWQIVRPRTAPLTAPELSLRIGALALVLPAPKLLEASAGNTINPLNTQKTATVEVSYPGMNPTHKVTLYAKGRAGFGSPVFASKPGSASGTLRFDVPLMAVPANIGTFLTFTYGVAQTGIHDQNSAAAKYAVTNIDNPQLRYPGVVIAESADKQILDLNAFNGDAHWNLLAWLFIAIGTRMRVALSGTGQNGAPYVFMLNDTTITANDVKDGLSGVISRTELKKYKDGTQLIAMAIANFSDQGGADTFFPILELTVKTEMLLKPAISQLIDNEGKQTGSVPNGGTCDDQTPELVGTATANTEVHLFNHGNRIGQATADKAGIWRTSISIAFGKHVITAKTPDGEQQSDSWTVIVAPDLQIGNNATLRLGELLLVPGRPPVSPPPGTLYWQQASGGTGPYSFTSSIPGVARIFDASGRVAATGNGTTTITVTDQSGQRASYDLTVTGIRNVGLHPPVTWYVWDQARWRHLCLNVWQFQTLWNTYVHMGNVPTVLGFPHSLYWTSTNNDYVQDVAYACDLNTGSGFQHSPGSLALYSLRFI